MVITGAKYENELSLCPNSKLNGYTPSIFVSYFFPFNAW